MNKTGELTALLRTGMGKAEVYALAAEAAQNPKIFRELVSLCLSANGPAARKAAWVLSHACEKNAAMAKPYVHHMLALVSAPLTPYPIIRDVLKALAATSLKESQVTSLTNICFELLPRGDADLAVKYTCKEWLEKQCKRYPELKRELLLVLEGELDKHTAAWQVQVHKTMQRLSR